MNLRAEWVGGDASWIAPAGLVLGHGRTRNWRVAHVHCQGWGTGIDPGALPGLEPLSTEPVFAAAGLSAFESETFRAWAEEAEGRLYVIGSVYGLSGAATVVSAQLLKLPLTLIPEACGHAADPAKPSMEHLRAQIASLSGSTKLVEIVGRRTSENVIQLAARRNMAPPEGEGG